MCSHSVSGHARFSVEVEILRLILFRHKYLKLHQNFKDDFKNREIEKTMKMGETAESLNQGEK